MGILFLYDLSELWEAQSITEVCCHEMFSVHGASQDPTSVGVSVAQPSLIMCTLMIGLSAQQLFVEEKAVASIYILTPLL